MWPLSVLRHRRHIGTFFESEAVELDFDVSFVQAFQCARLQSRAAICPGGNTAMFAGLNAFGEIAPCGDGSLVAPPLRYLTVTYLLPVRVNFIASTSIASALPWRGFTHSWPCRRLCWCQR